MTHIEAMKQALELLRKKEWEACDYTSNANKAAELLEQAIATEESSATQEPEAAPVAKNEGGRITWMIEDWPQNCLLYTHPPKSFTYKQVKAHIRAVSMSANDIAVGSDITDDGISIVIRRRDEILYAEFFAHPQSKAEQEPVAWGVHDQIALNKTLETHPQPKREWVGLDPEEIRTTKHHMVEGAYHYSFKQGAEWAEAKLKEKNA